MMTGSTLWVTLVAVVAALAAAAAYLRARLSRPRRDSGARGGEASEDDATGLARNVAGRISAVTRLFFPEAPDPGAGKPGVPGALQGNLAQTPLHDLLQYLSLGAKSGMLELACGRRTGRIVMLEGGVATSEYRGKEGEEAIFQMLDLTEGDFEFHEQRGTDPKKRDADAPAGAATMEVVGLIMLWMDRKPRKRHAPG